MLLPRLYQADCACAQATDARCGKTFSGEPLGVTCTRGQLGSSKRWNQAIASRWESTTRADRSEASPGLRAASLEDAASLSCAPGEQDCGSAPPPGAMESPGRDHAPLAPTGPWLRIPLASDDEHLRPNLTREYEQALPALLDLTVWAVLLRRVVLARGPAALE